MIELTTAEIAELTHGEARVESVVTGVAIDSRRVTPGDLFVALAGERADGADFADDALAAGAAAALVPRGQEGAGRIAVDDPLDALAVVAREVRLRGTASVVGITGSTGKTSTKDILAALLAPHTAVVASRQNENNELGVPLTLSRIEPTTGVAVVEMAMRGLGQIAHLAAIARPQIGIVTGVGPVHLELLGTIENVARAKAELLQALPADGTAIVPHGEPLLEPHLADLGCTRGQLRRRGRRRRPAARVHGRRRRRAGGDRASRSNPVRARELHRASQRPQPGGRSGCLRQPWPAAGRAGAGRRRRRLLALARRGDRAARGRPADRRLLQRQPDLDGGRAAPPVGLGRGPAAGGGAGRHGRAGRRRRRYHREVGELLAELGIEVVVAVGPESRAYGGSWFATVAELREALGDVIEPGDAVLVKASRSVGLEDAVEAIAP